MAINVSPINELKLSALRKSLLRTSVIVVSVIFCGCSSGRPPPTLSTFECSSNLVSSVKLPKARSDDPQVTRLTLGGQTVFATSLIECGVRDYVPTRATSRQLLSGFDNLIITSEGFADQQNHSKKIYIITGTAQIDTRPIEVMAASSRSADCVTDSVFWKEIPNTQTPPSLQQTIMPIIECVK